VAIARERSAPLAERTFRASRASYEANRTDFSPFSFSSRVPHGPARDGSSFSHALPPRQIWTCARRNPERFENGEAAMTRAWVKERWAWWASAAWARGAGPRGLHGRPRATGECALQEVGACRSASPTHQTLRASGQRDDRARARFVRKADARFRRGGGEHAADGCDALHGEPRQE